RLSGKAPEASHCTNIGALHRAGIHAAFEKWFGLKVKEARDRRSAADLLCLTKEMKPRPAHELAAARAEDHAALAQLRQARQTPVARRKALREEWARLLGVSEARAGAKLTAHGKARVAGVTVERFALEVDPGIPVPVILLLPPHKAGARLPVVVAF